MSTVAEMEKLAQDVEVLIEAHVYLGRIVPGSSPPGAPEREALFAILHRLDGIWQAAVLEEAERPSAKATATRERLTVLRAQMHAIWNSTQPTEWRRRG